MSAEAASEALLTFIETHTQVENTKYLAVVSYTLLVYDILICLDNEVTFIWSNRWSYGHAVHHMIRVLPLVVLSTGAITLFDHSPSQSICKPASLLYIYGCTSCALAISVIVTMCCWVLYERGTLMLILLLTGLGATFVPVLYLVWYEKDKSIYLGNTYPGLLSGCVIIPSSKAWVAYVFLFVFETVVFLLALRKTIQLNSQFGTTPMVEHLLKDGSFFYGAILLVVLFTSIGGAMPILRMAAVTSGFFTAFSSVLCSRMIFSLHAFSRSNLTTTGFGTVPRGTFGIATSTQMTTFRTQSHVIDGPGGNEDLGSQGEVLR